MQKNISKVIGLLIVLFLCSGCGPSKEEKNEEARKRSMGRGDLKVDGSSTAHGGI